MLHYQPLTDWPQYFYLQSYIKALPLHQWPSQYHSLIIWATKWQNQQNGCAASEDSDQPGHPPSLTRVFAVRLKKASFLSCPLSVQRRLWSDWAEHTHFVGFVVLWLICNSILVSNVYIGNSLLITVLLNSWSAYSVWSKFVQNCF